MYDYTKSSSRSGGLSTPSLQTLKMLRVALQCLDASCGHDEWFRIGAAVHTMTNGHSEGLKLFDDWSRNSRKYPGRRRMECQWGSYDKHTGNRMGMPTLRRFVEQTETTWAWVCAEADLGDRGQWA